LYVWKRSRNISAVYYTVFVSATRGVIDYNFAALIYFTANAAVGVNVREPPLNKYKAERARGRLSITMFIHNEIIYIYIYTIYMYARAVYVTDRNGNVITDARVRLET